MSTLYFFDDAVGAKDTQPMGYSGREASSDGGIVITWKENVANIAVSKSVDVELTTADGLEKVGIVLRPGAKSTNRTPITGSWTANRGNQLAQWALHLDRGQCVQVAFVGCMGYSGTAIKIGNALSHSPPGSSSTWISFFGTIDLEVRRVIHCGLNSKNASLLIVDLDGVCLELMLEAYPFRAFALSY
jgi:hypothetical protein